MSLLKNLAGLLLPLAFAITAHASAAADATPTPGIVDKTLEILHLKHAPKSQNPPQMHHEIELQLDITPTPIDLSKDREVQVTVTVFNRSKKNFVHIDFPTSQRIEILVREASGKVVNTWSEDQSFTNDPATVTINPGERLQYTASVATREMNSGQPYTIEASFPSDEELKIQQQVIPRK
jgi:hypothetical protein